MLQFDRLYTEEGQDVYGSFPTKNVDVNLQNMVTKESIFKMDGVEVPIDFSDNAAKIISSKYFRMAGVPDTPEGKEKSVIKLVSRIAETIYDQGVQQGYFDKSQGEVFRDELANLMLSQRGVFNSPVLFNLGLENYYGIDSPSEDATCYWDEETDAIKIADTKYKHPQASACFINSVEDKMLGDGGIYDFIAREARIFKYGSGSGANFSDIRAKGESLSSGGTSSGLMSFLKIPDESANCVKSGGTTRRAAKMVILDYTHPEIEDFVSWKKREEDKAALLGLRYDNDEALSTVSGQNSNNSVRIDDEFMQAVIENEDYHTYFIRNKNEDGSKKIAATKKARDLFTKISEASWNCGDPGLQFDSAINEWHTCPNSGRINSSNPCSEYMFVDNSACNLASLNLMKYLTEEGSFNFEGFKHDSKLLLTAQDILVDYASYPDEKIALNSHKFRPLGLGYANLGSLVMNLGLAYDSHESRELAASITALMTGTAYQQSIELAKVKGTFEEYEKNKEPFLKVMKKHSEAIRNINQTDLNKTIIRESRKVWKSVLEELGIVEGAPSDKKADAGQEGKTEQEEAKQLTQEIEKIMGEFNDDEVDAIIDNLENNPENFKNKTNKA